MSDSIFVIIYFISVCIVVISCVFEFRNRSQITLFDAIMNVFAIFTPLVNTIVAIMLICVWIDKSHKIIIYRK